MACSILIDSVTLGSGGVVTIQGRLMNLTHCGLALPVTLNCGGATFSGAATTTPGPGYFTWVAYLQTSGCSCDTSVFVTVTNLCPGEECETTYSGPLCCCPTVGTNIQYGVCNSNNNTQLVTFDTSIYINNNCTIQIRRDFGNGVLGAIQAFTGPGNFNYSESHSYATPATYISVVNAIPPTVNCPAINATNVSVLCDAGCYGSSFLAGFCRALAWLFLFSTTAGLTTGLAGCFPVALSLGFLAVGVLTLAIYMFLQCQRCVCDFILNLWGKVFLATGFASLMFIPAGCVLTGVPALINSLIFFTLGFVVLSIWYINNRNICPLNRCDFWCSISGPLNFQSATYIALAVMIALFAILPSLILGFGLAALITTLFISIIAWPSVGPLGTPPCNGSSPTCQ